ncbi:MAG: hypothetical protein RBR48_03685 [Bacilli bacterium]|jgi:pyroglutamyl-peptidase|nr:hypothetical protein [Bacilli bacterium]MDY0209260.1 hypothetical protein [Bacilli bacterium]
MKKIILTAFEPFGSLPTNSSFEVLKALPEDDLKVILPVSYNKCDDLIKHILLEQKPDYLLLLGQAQNRRAIALEQIAINLVNTPTRDNDGNFYINHLIKEDGHHGYFNTIEASSLVEELASTFPLYLSYSAGTYVCNYSFYLALYYVNQYQLPTKVGFIHFPLYKKQTEDDTLALELDTMVKATSRIIKILHNKKSS